MAWTLTELTSYSVPTNGTAPDIYGTAFAVGELNSGTAGLESVHGSGTDLSSSPVYGRATVRDAAGNTLFTITSENEDYVMSADIGDPDEDGVNSIAIGWRNKDNKGALYDNSGTKEWEWSSFATGTDYVRIAKIGKVTSATGKQVLFGGNNGRMALLDKDGAEIWDVNLTAATGLPTCQAAYIVDLDEDGNNEVYVASNRFIHKLNNNTGAILWSATVMTPASSSGASIMGFGYGRFLPGVSGIQLVGAIATRGDTAVKPAIVWVDKDGNVLQTRYLHYDAYCVTSAEINGQTYLFVGGGSHDLASPPNLGWGYIMMFTGAGEPLALLNVASSVKGIGWADINNDGQGEIIGSDDTGKLRIIRVSQT